MKFSATNFLDIFHQKKRRQRRFFLFVRILSYIFVFAVAASLIFLVVYFQAARDVYDLAQSGKKNLEMAAERAENLDFPKANFYLKTAENNLEEAKTRLESLNFLRKVPWAKNQFEAVYYLLAAGVETSSALQDAVGAANEVMAAAGEADALLQEISLPGAEMTFSKLTLEKKREVLKKLFESSSRLSNVKEKIDSAILSLEKISESGAASQILKAASPMREALIKIQSTIVRLIPAAEILPQIAGYPEEKIYLFLLQNSDEMRPTGGFIGTYGIVKVKDGGIEMFETDNIYGLDGPAEKFLKVEPPAPIKKYLKINNWFMRDSNWSPDFPTSAAKAEWFYRAEGGPEQKIDAVVAVTPTLIEGILRQIGNIEMDGAIFTPDNLMEVLQYKVEKEYYEKGIPEIRRKDVVGQLANKIFERMANLPFSKWNEIWKIFEKSFQEKHLLFWSKNPELQKVIAREKWGGEVQQFDGDYLMVIDANLAGLKTDGVMDKKINYFLTAGSDGQLRAKVDIVYKNNGSFSWKTTRYRTYTRVYAPRGSVFLEGRGMMENDKVLDPSRRPGKIDVGEEFGKTYFGAFISVEPGEEKILTFEYLLPAEISEKASHGLYKLFVQKQAGTFSHPLTLNLNFGKTIKRAAPAEEEKEWGNEVYGLSADLRVDRGFEVGF